MAQGKRRTVELRENEEEWILEKEKEELKRLELF